MEEFSFFVRDSEDEDLIKLVNMKGISEQELNWDPPEEYMEEFSRLCKEFARKTRAWSKWLKPVAN